MVKIITNEFWKLFNKTIYSKYAFYDNNVIVRETQKNDEPYERHYYAKVKRFNTIKKHLDTNEIYAISLVLLCNEKNVKFDKEVEIEVSKKNQSWRTKHNLKIYDIMSKDDLNTIERKIIIIRSYSELNIYNFGLDEFKRSKLISKIISYKENALTHYF